MDEFLKLKWSTKDLSVFEQQVQVGFIPENVVANSLIYKHFQNKTLFKVKSKKKKQTIFEEKVYTPGATFPLITFVKSAVDEYVQKHCLEALKLFQSGKDTSCFTTSEQYCLEIFKFQLGLDTLYTIGHLHTPEQQNCFVLTQPGDHRSPTTKKFKPKIIEENSKYESFVQHKWNVKDSTHILKIKPGIRSFGNKIWQEKWKKIVLYPQFYKEQSTFNVTFNENESIIDFKCINNVLELGTLARFSHPNLKSPCHLKTVTLPLQGTEENTVYSSLPVSQDQNINKILENNDVDLVISASGLKCITDISDGKRRWMIPVVVKKVTIKKDDGNTIQKNVVFLDKPFSQNQISYVDLAYISFKRLIKTNFCQFEAFRYSKEDSALKEEDKVDYKSAFADSSHSFDNPRNRHHNIIHHNASYRIWNVKKTYCQSNLIKNKGKAVDFNVLIRSKLDACECNEQGALQPVILKPKLEMQLRYGATISSKTELAKEWTSLFFTPFSNLYRVRISPISGEVICVEKCNIQKIVAEAQTHYQYKPQLGLGILQKVFEELINLEPGKYLLQHLPKHEAFVAILKECELGSSRQGDIFDLHAEYDKVTLEKLPQTWIPIDVNFVLPSFEAINRMPGMFTPRKPLNKGGKFKKKQRGKGDKIKIQATE